MLEMLHEPHAGEAEATEVAPADSVVPSELPCLQNVSAENRVSTDPAQFMTCLLECQTCTKV